MKLSNVIGLGLGGVLCVGLLSACGDGRGANGFKSYQYSKEERERNRLKRDGAKPADGPKNTQTDDTNKGDVGLGTSVVLAPDSGRGTGEPIFDPAPVASEGDVSGSDKAQGKGMTEPAPGNISEVPSQTASVDKLMVTANLELSQKEPNAVAMDLVKGITILPNGGTNVARTITLQALVKVNGEEMIMDAADVPVKFADPKKGDKVPNILFTLTKPCDENKPFIVKDLLQAVAYCRDANCLQIQVTLEFKTAGRPAYAVLIVQPAKDEAGKLGWAYVGSNIGKNPKTFQQAQLDMKPCAMPKPEVPAPAPGTTAPAPGADAGGTSAPAVNAEEQARLAKEKAEREAADAKQCEEVKKEGFSCDDSPGEIARMRNNRRAQAEAAEAARKEKEAQEAEAHRQGVPFTGDGSEHTPEGPKASKPAPASPSATEEEINQANATGGFQ